MFALQTQARQMRLDETPPEPKVYRLRPKRKPRKAKPAAPVPVPGPTEAEIRKAAAEAYRRYAARPWGKDNPVDKRIARKFYDIEATGEIFPC